MDNAVTTVVNSYTEAKQANARFYEDVEKRYRAFRGVMEKNSAASGWTSKMHPPYLNQLVEGITASLVESIQFKVRPRPKSLSQEDAEAAVKAAETVERLLNYELDLDNFDRKLQEFIRQGLVTGLTVGKTYWRQKKVNKKFLGSSQANVQDDMGRYQGQITVPEEQQKEEYVVDDPCFTVVDVRDFFWPESATSVEDADWLIHRSYMTLDQCKKMEKIGVWKNTADLVVSGEGDNTDREYMVRNTSRAKNRVEVLEYWTEDRVIVVGNGNILLRDYENPFWHGQKPFIIASAMPDLFQLPGMSVVELCSHLQEMLWTLQNQRLDALRLIANPVFLIRSDVENPDQMEFYPGAQWIVEQPDQIKQLQIDPAVAEISLQAESLLKGDLQNLTGGGLMSGAATDTLDQKTATGVSIVTTLAQRMIGLRKQNFQMAMKEVGVHFIEMTQQFMRDDRVISIVGADGSTGFLDVGPQEIQGRFDVIVEVSNESLIRQERRAERQALLQVAAQVAPLLAAVGTPINMKAFMDDLLEAFDVGDKERYYSQKPEAQNAQGGPVGQQAPGQGPSNGTTSPLATNPAYSPSNTTSMSGETAMQRLQAMKGGPANR